MFWAYRISIMTLAVNLFALRLQQAKVSKGSWLMLMLTLGLSMPLTIHNSFFEHVVYVLAYFMVLVVNKQSFACSLTQAFTVNTYVYLASKLAGNFLFFTSMVDNLLVFFVLQIIFSYLIHILINKLSRWIIGQYPQIQDWIFIPHALLYFYVLYDYISLYLFDFIVVQPFHQDFFRNTYLSLVLFFLVSCIGVNYLSINQGKQEENKAKRYIEQELFTYLSNQATVSKLFIHDKIRTLNQIEEMADNEDMTHSLNQYLQELRDHLKSQDHSLISLVLIEPILLQNYLYNQLIWLQQLEIPCRLEIANKMNFSGNLLRLIHYLDLLFKQAAEASRLYPKPELNLSITDNGPAWVIILNYKTDKAIEMIPKLKKEIINDNDFLISHAYRQVDSMNEIILSITNREVT